MRDNPVHSDDLSPVSLFIYVVCAHREEAQAIARLLLERRLAACANILPGHESLYWWDGAIQQGTEVVLILKTRAALYQPVEDAIKAAHSYAVPCIVAWPLERGFGPYLEWIEAQTVQ